MKKMICVLAALLCVAALTAASADQAVSLPGGFTVDIPEGMAYDGEKGSDSDFRFAYVSGDLEMDVFAYAEDASLSELAETLADQGNDVQLRRVNGTEAAVFRGSDPSDGAPFIGYLIKNGGELTEIVFWYANSGAAELCRNIMETLR